MLYNFFYANVHIISLHSLSNGCLPIVICGADKESQLIPEDLKPSIEVNNANDLIKIIADSSKYQELYVIF